MSDPPGPDAAGAAIPRAAELERFLRGRGHGDDARDLVQELFVILLARAQPVESGSPGKFRSFLYAIAYRLSSNASRRRARRASEPLDENLAGGTDPEQLALSADRVRRAAAALDSLPETTRRALLLVADERRSVREVAAILGISEDAVRARLCRGRKRLARILEETP